MGNTNGQTALHAVARCSAFLAVTQLLNAGADASRCHDVDCTALYMAASS